MYMWHVQIWQSVRIIGENNYADQISQDRLYRLYRAAITGLKDLYRTVV